MIIKTWFNVDDSSDLRWIHLEPWSQPELALLGPGVKYLDRKSSRPVTWVIKIKHAGLGVLDQSDKRQAASLSKQHKQKAIRGHLVRG